VALILGPAAEAFARWLGFSGTVLAIGGLLFFDYLAGEAREKTEGSTRVRTVRLVATIAILVAACLRLVQQAAAFSETPAEWTGMVPTILRQTTWGKAWIAHILAGAILMLTSRADQARAGGVRSIRWIAAGVLCATPAFAGHAIGSETWTRTAIIMDGLHVFAASIWMGGLAALAFGWISAGGEVGTSARLHLVLDRFSPLAVLSVLALLVSGVFASWLHVGAWNLLWTSTYGRLLLIKIGLVAIIGALGAYHWRVVTPRLRTGSGVGRARRSMGLEALLGFVAIAVTAVLVSAPLPGEP
jgi:copper transport protein